jgi:hypothetical protein
MTESITETPKPLFPNVTVTFTNENLKSSSALFILAGKCGRAARLEGVHPREVARFYDEVFTERPSDLEYVKAVCQKWFTIQ